MKKYQLITLAFLLILFLGLGNRQSTDIANVTLQVHQALWHEPGETIDISKLADLSIETIEISDGENVKTLSLQELVSYFDKQFPGGYGIQSYSRSVTEILGFWGRSSSQFKVDEDIQGTIEIRAWRFLSDWNISSIKLTFDDKSDLNN